MSYKLIHETYWTDPKIKQLSIKNKLLFLYFITNPHSHYSGIYYLPESVIIEETGLSKSEVRYGIDTLSKGYLIKHDNHLKCIWVIKMLKYQAQGEKQRKGIENHLKELHNTILIKDFLEYYKKMNIPYQYPIDTVSGGYHTVSGSVSEEESVSGSVSENRKKEKGMESMNLPFTEIITDLNEKTSKNYKLTKATKELINARISEGFTLEDFKKVHTNMSAKWKHDPKMNQYLRPTTLYAISKFEGYVNAGVSLSDKGIISEKTEKGMQVMKDFIGGVNAQ